MQSQRQPDSLAVIGGGSVASGIPVGPRGVAGRTTGQPVRHMDSLQPLASLSAPGRWDSHCA
jgi:hypothetical protein